MEYLRKTKLVLLIVIVFSFVGARPIVFAFQTSIAEKSQASLDFQTYRTRVEPIFLKKRENGVHCYDCHSVLATPLKLQPLNPGSSSWTEDQSRQNFQAVSQVIDRSDPLKSPLLLHPLAPEAGGDPVHTGGKFWKSQADLEWQAIASWIGQPSPTPQFMKPASASKSATLDYEFFKASVQPIFLRERSGHARCYGCHVLSNRSFHLEPLSAGNETWTEEQSQRNFESALHQVVPGLPTSSRLLMHPLAPEADGEPFHSGGRQFASQTDTDWLTIARWIRGAATQANAARIYVTNSAGDTVEGIDPGTNKVVQVIRGIELPHGIAFSPEGNRIYVSNESESVLNVIDRQTGEIEKKIPLSDRPNNIAISKDGSRVLVGIRAEPGSLDVIDTKSLQRVNNIPVHGSVHNVYVTPDGKYAVSGSIESKAATVVDLETQKAIWTVQFDNGVRPMTFETNADGSTARIFVQLSTFNGFAVVDFTKRAEVARIKLPDQPGGFGVAEGRLGTPSHGIGVAPDGKSLWVNSTVANATFKYSLPDLKLIGHVGLPEVHPLGQPPTGSVPEWITFSPNGKVLYVSNSAAASVSVIDTENLKMLAVIPVGEVPKRLNTFIPH